MVRCLEQIEKQTADQRAQCITQYPHEYTGRDLVMPSFCCRHCGCSSGTEHGRVGGGQ